MTYLLPGVYTWVVIQRLIPSGFTGQMVIVQIKFHVCVVGLAAILVTKSRREGEDTGSYATS